MSLNMSSDSASSLSSENAIPKFPDRKEEFHHWRMVMRAYLDAKGYLHTIEHKIIQDDSTW